MKVPYERVIQWVSGPFSVLIGGVATKLIAAHGALLSSVGLSVKGTSQAIVSASVFIVSSGVTYLAHHKWLDNAAKWWQVQVGTQIPGFDSAPLEARLTALERAQEPTTSGVLAGDDNPDYAAVAQRRQDIAESMPMRDPHL